MVAQSSFVGVHFATAGSDPGLAGWETLDGFGGCASEDWWVKSKNRRPSRRFGCLDTRRPCAMEREGADHAVVDIA